MVGVRGFEPRAFWSQTRCSAQTELYPVKLPYPSASLIGQRSATVWSGQPVSNRPPRPWQGGVLPTELCPRPCPMHCCTGTVMRLLIVKERGGIDAQRCTAAPRLELASQPGHGAPHEIRPSHSILRSAATQRCAPKNKKPGVLSAHPGFWGRVVGSTRHSPKFSDAGGMAHYRNRAHKNCPTG